MDKSEQLCKLFLKDFPTLDQNDNELKIGMI